VFVHIEQDSVDPTAHILFYLYIPTFTTVLLTALGRADNKDSPMPECHEDVKNWKRLRGGYLSCLAMKESEEKEDKTNGKLDYLF
jgi:hypothetical protein